MNRRTFLLLSAASGVAMSPLAAAAAEPLKELRIGYQKTSVLLVVKAQHVLEKRFESDGVAVRWVEFPFGPPLLEALNVGAIDYGYTGNAPPIFAQAAHANIQYVAVIPTRGYGQAIVVPDASPLQSLADLLGKKIGVAKGSSAHDLLVAALESANIPWSEITPVYLAPADAAAAFARGAIDAWSIWDPFYAIAELKQKARALPIEPKAMQQNSFFLANSDFIAKHADVVATLNEEIAKATKWAGEHRDETAELFAEASGVDLAAQQKAVARAEFSFGPLDDKAIAQQQAVADRFYRLGLIPTPVAVRDIVWTRKPNS
ncbi:MAG TPA: aliphatic sulfonate ABC transporter substrate-binding protein [Xanthobacteraceae bacterium]|nr:aliphatic sulfonate ABC transporter substrate-binding protein [Xanthobacteraceae bacterium]